MVTVLHLMLRRFHHFTELKKNLGNKTLVLPQSTSYNTIIMQVISKSIRDLQSSRLNKQNTERVKFKQQSFNVLQEKLNLANARNNSIYQPLMCIAFGPQKTQDFL